MGGVMIKVGQFLSARLDVLPVEITDELAGFCIRNFSSQRYRHITIVTLFTGAIVNGPAYLIFPIISLSPVITILISLIVLKEKASKIGWAGIVLAVFAIP